MTENKDGHLFPEPPPTLTRLTLRGCFAFVGPGVIIASVTIGSGELVWASRAGAIFSCSLLWCFLLAGVFKAFQVYTAARQITLTGEHPLVTWRTMPGPPLWFPLLIALPTAMVMPIAFSGISEILGGYIHKLTGLAMDGDAIGPFEHLELWINVWASVVLTTCLVLALSSSLATLERVSAVVLGIVVLCATIAVIVCRPNLVEVLIGSLVPLIPDYEPWVKADFPEVAKRSPWLEVAVYLTAVGGGTYDYIGYVGMLREKRWGLAGSEPIDRDKLAEAVTSSPRAETELQRARAWTRAPLLDTTISFSAVILVTLLFAVLGALVLHTQQVIPDKELLSKQAEFLTLLHPKLNWVYIAGVFLAFIGTLYGAFEIYQHTTVETVRALLPQFAEPAHEKVWRRLTVAYCYGGGIVVLWLPKGIAGDVVERMIFGAVISGATLCGAWCFAMLWSDQARLPAPLRMSRLLWWSTLIAGVVMSGLGVQTLLTYFG